MRPHRCHHNRLRPPACAGRNGALVNDTLVTATNPGVIDNNTGHIIFAVPITNGLPPVLLRPLSRPCRRGNIRCAVGRLKPFDPGRRRGVTGDSQNRDDAQEAPPASGLRCRSVHIGLAHATAKENRKAVHEVQPPAVSKIMSALCPQRLHAQHTGQEKADGYPGSCTITKGHCSLTDETTHGKHCQPCPNSNP